MSLHNSSSPETTSSESIIESLSDILSPLPSSLTASETPAFTLLHDPQLAEMISTHLRQPNSGAGDNALCRWLYDTFQSSDPNLQLVVLRFLPIIAGIYLSRVILRKPLAGFEAILLALYSHETMSRGGQPISVNIPDLSHSSLYHETKVPIKNYSTGLNLAIVSPSLEPHGTIRSTRRARIVGVTLELYYTKISLMPISSKIDFCEFCVVWAGDQHHDNKKVSSSDDLGDEGEDIASSSSTNKEVNGGRIPLPWELLQPILRILGHCLMGSDTSKELKNVAFVASKSLYERALHDVNAQAILASGSLVKLGKTAMDAKEEDPTEIRDYMNPLTTL
ncbi:hypothetical protein GIB67_006712 [Kingdonia uniflora]|uniref:Hyccin n=1 Tax=Kingdonia uniflora TaxID=39325 RepID=A0A7J7LYQ5_9MAGN|nr:hypothetical protein GIB67_006712 [Kingdonia uniflora]